MAFLDENSSASQDRGGKSFSLSGRRVVLLLLMTVAVGSYFLFSPPEEEPLADVVETVPTPLPTPEPTPEPEPEPEPVRPTPPPAEPEPTPEPPPPTHILRVTSDVTGAQVFLNRRFLGNTPLDMANLEPGQHQLNVAAQGYEGITRTIDISETPVELNIEFQIVRLDETVDVIHKHRFGSCQGQLVANLQGFHYQTAHNDAFSVPLDQVELFEVDYLDHRLQLKVRGGRNYNFTDEQDTADPLFVFHRDVEKARTRLAQGDQPASNDQ